MLAMESFRLRYLIIATVVLIAAGVPLSRMHDFREIGIILCSGAVISVLTALVIAWVRSQATDAD